MFYGNVDLEKLHRKLKANPGYYSVELYMDSHVFTANIIKDGESIRTLSTKQLVEFIESDNDIGE